MIKAGLDAYQRLDYQRAIGFLNRALSETLTREEKHATYLTLGLCHVALGDAAEAQRDFENLLRIDPNWQPKRSMSPRVRAIFESARSGLATGKVPGNEAGGTSLPTVSPEISPDGRVREGTPVTMSVRYPGGVGARMEVYHRARGAPRFSIVGGLGAAGKFEITVPGRDVRPPALEWYMVVLDEHGAAVAGSGTLGKPQMIEVIAPIYKRGWFWGVVGGLVGAGAIAGLAAGLTLPPNSAQLTLQLY